MRLRGQIGDFIRFEGVFRVGFLYLKVWFFILWEKINAIIFGVSIILITFVGIKYQPFRILKW